MAAAISLYGFWIALTAIAVPAIMVWRKTFDRDRNGLISERACRGIGPLLGCLILGAAVIAISSGVLGEPDGTRSSNQIPILARHVADSPVLMNSLTLVIILWWYALLSVVVVNILRHRQLHRLRRLPASGRPKRQEKQGDSKR